MKNIGFIGKMGSGKTTCARFLEKEKGYIRVPLAEPVYQLVGNLDYLTNEESYKRYIYPYVKNLYRKKLYQAMDKVRKIPDEHPKPRKRLQALGTDWGRDFIDPRIWINILLIKSYEFSSPIVVDDIRFINEGDILTDEGFYVYKLILPEDIRIKRLRNLYPNFDEKVLSHKSERDFYSIPFNEELPTSVSLEATLSRL